MSLKEDVKNLPLGTDLWNCTPEQRKVMGKHLLVLFIKAAFFCLLAWLFWKFK